MKRILTLILFFAFIIIARAQSNYQQNLLYTYNSGNQTAELVFFRDKSYSGAIEIPETVIYNGITYRVTSIGEVAFANCSGLTSVKIPNSIVTIKNNAFKNCKGLKSLEIPNGVTTIGEYAFQSSGLETIKFANSVTKIGAWAFYFCTNLITVQLPENITRIEEGQFYRCSKLKNINLDNITSIGDQAFSYMSGVTLELPSKVESIGNNAFAKSQFMTVKIPSSVTSIGRTIFYNNINLTYIQVDPNNKVYDSRDDCNAIIETATNKLVEGCRNSDIPTSVTTIGEGAFNGCTGFGSSLMGSWTFEIPSNIETIEDFAFKSCAFSGLIIPSNVKSIGNQAFDDCSDLTSIIVDKENTIYDSRDDCNAIIETSSNKLIRGCVNTQIPNTVSIIGKFAFDGCYRPPLESIVIPKSVRIIEEKAFGYCSSLKEVFCYSEDVPETDASAFYSSSIESATLYVPESAIESFKSSTPWNTFKEILVAPRPKYKLEYYIGTDLFKTYELEEGETITPEVEPTKEGYTFSGWSEIPETMPAKNVTITGSFTINKYNVTYIVDGTEYKSTEMEFGMVITPEPAPTKMGYTFSGWSEIPNTVPSHDVTITGTFTINKYNLTYMVDGVEYKKIEVEYGSSLTPIDEPTKTGYTFTGWVGLPETMPNHDVTVVGRFSVNSYMLTYIVDGVEYKTATIDYGATITPESNPTKEGYTFSGWSEIPATMPASDVTVIGSFSINRYTIIYIVDGVEYKTVTIDYGSAITAETVPTKEGYTFSGWSEIPATMPAKDVTITGSFTINKYKVTYIVDGVEYKTETVEYGSQISAPNAPDKEGYTFVWTDLPETMPAHDITVTGTYSVNSYKITYVDYGTVIQTVEIEYGAEVNPISAPEKEGYTFVGWSNLPDYMPAHDVTVIANYEPNSYNLIYMVDGVEYKKTTEKYGYTVNPEDAPTKEGYTFSGWEGLPETMPAHDVTVTGTFTINTYKIIYMVDGVEYGTSEVTYGAEVNPIGEPSKEGYTFSGWMNLPEEMPAHDVTVTGTFSVNSYKVTFVYGDSVLTTIEVNYGEAIELPTSLNSERYTLVEWKDVPDTMPAYDITIYADYVDGINTITADRKDEQYIRMNGMYTPDLKPGLNIIRMKDGTTKKVWVK